MSPTQRSLVRLRKLGFLAAVVEKWNPHVGPHGIRQDLFGIGDVLAVHARDRIFLLVQATTAGNISSRLRKAKQSGELKLWLAAGGRFVVLGWQKRDGRWEAREVEVTLADEDLAAVVPQRRKRKKAEPNLFDGA